MPPTVAVDADDTSAPASRTSDTVPATSSERKISAMRTHSEEEKAR